MPEISRFWFKMNYDLKNIEYQHDYIYKVSFEDGTTGLVDFDDVIHSSNPYNLLLNMNLFKKAYIHPELKTLTWADDLDFDPIIFYYKANNIPFPAPWGEIN